MSQNKRSDDPDCMTSPESLLQGRKLIIVSNRGPFNFSEDENGSLQIQRQRWRACHRFAGVNPEHWCNLGCLGYQ